MDHLSGEKVIDCIMLLPVYSMKILTLTVASFLLVGSVALLNASPASAVTYTHVKTVIKRKVTPPKICVDNLVCAKGQHFVCVNGKSTCVGARGRTVKRSASSSPSSSSSASLNATCVNNLICIRGKKPACIDARPACIDAQ